MTPLRRQFFFSFGVIGSVMPLMSVFLWKEGGFGFFQIGLATALANVPLLVSPGLITLLADRRIDSRRILAVSFLVSGIVLSLMYAVPTLWIRMVLFLFHGLAFVAMLPLQDGFYFTYAQKQRQLGNTVGPYPTVRVWGTVGFIVPSVLMYFLLRDGASTSRILLCAIGFAFASLLNSFTLPSLKRPEGKENPEATEAEKEPETPLSESTEVPEKAMLPTSRALRTLFSPQARFLCLGLALSYMAAVAYYSFISIYFREVIGIEDRHIGLVINIGVVLEVAFTLLMPRLQSLLRLKGIMIVGLAFMALRMILLAVFPSFWTAVLTQLGHGMEVLALFIAPVMFLDRLAGDEFRNSIQGVFTMAVGGVARIVGAVVAGFVATIGLQYLLGYAAALALAALFVIVFKFKRIPTPDEEDPAEATP